MEDSSAIFATPLDPEPEVHLKWSPEDKKLGDVAPE